MNVIFDLGNVVIDWNVKKILHSLEMPLAVQQEIKTQLFGHADWLDLDCGTQTEPQVIANIVARSTLTEEQVKLALLKAKQSLDILDESVQLMQEASKAGHKLYCLSNMSVETYNHIKHHDFLNLFDGIVISSIEKCMKPDAKIFELILSRYNLIPSDTLFIDDSKPNIVSANKLGIQTFHFTRSKDDYTKLSEQLAP